MGTIDPSKILGYGAIGLGFLLAFLSYLLLAAEQKRDIPRESMVRSIYFFMAFAFSLSLLGFGSEYLKNQIPSRNTRNSTVIWWNFSNPQLTAAGDADKTRAEIDNILRSSVMPAIQQKCTMQPDREYHAVVRIDMHKDDGKNDPKHPTFVYMGGSDSNFDNESERCVRFVFQSTAFPESLQAPQPDKDMPPNSYWFLVRISFPASSQL